MYSVVVMWVVGIERGESRGAAESYSTSEYCSRERGWQRTGG
jgi:hypothetical protein